MVPRALVVTHTHKKTTCRNPDSIPTQIVSNRRIQLRYSVYGTTGDTTVDVHRNFLLKKINTFGCRATVQCFVTWPQPEKFYELKSWIKTAGNIFLYYVTQSTS